MNTNLSDITIKSSISGSLYLTLTEEEKKNIEHYKRMSKKLDVFYELLSDKIEKLNKILEKEIPGFELNFDAFDSYCMDDDDFLTEE